MKTHTNNFKNQIKTLGRELAINITYGNSTLNNEQINSVNLNYKGDILKSVMKQLKLDSNIDIPLETQINVQIGLLVNESYEYINYGDFIVNKSEKQENTNSYILTCYDSMLLSMVPYEDLGVTYPITIRNYIDAICDKLGLTFANSSDTFTNYDKEIQNELYLDSDGNSLDYTFRDVLDELAQVTASTICINDDNELEVRYITNTNDTIDEEYLKNVNVKFGELYGPINTITFSRSADSDNISLSIPVDLDDNLKKEIKISDNQILNSNNRDAFLSGILNTLYGLSYYINDYSSTGILYYDLCDRYDVSIDNTTYSCVMLNDEINLSNGLVENIHTDIPKDSKTDYTKTDKTDKKVNQAYLIVNKQEGTIQGLVNRVSDAEEDITIINANADSISARVTSVQTQADSSSNAISTLTNQVNILESSTALEINAIETALENGVENVKNSLVTIDTNGIKTSKDNETFNTQITNKTFEVKDRDKELAFIGYDTSLNKTIARIPELEARQITAGVHRCETITRNGNKRTAWFYVGGGN